MASTSPATRAHFPAFGRGLSLRRTGTVCARINQRNFLAFGRGLSLRLNQNTMRKLTITQRFPRLRAWTFIEASSRTATSEAPRMISSLSGGDFHGGQRLGLRSTLVALEFPCLRAGTFTEIAIRNICRYGPMPMSRPRMTMLR